MARKEFVTGGHTGNVSDLEMLDLLDEDLTEIEPEEEEEFFLIHNLDDEDSLHVYDSYDDRDSEDIVYRYLKEAGQTPLLTAHEEIALAQRIEAGVLAKQKLEQLLVVEELNDQDLLLLKQTQDDGKSAQEHLTKANLRLVVSVAKKYLGRGVPFLDLIQEGNIGLMKAVDKYDYRRGHKFSTYATWWIRQSVSRGVADQGRTIRVPVHRSDDMRRMWRAKRDLEQSLGRVPTIDEIASEVEMPPKKVEQLMLESRRPFSLDHPVSPDGDSGDEKLGDLIEDDKSQEQSHIVFIKQLRAQIEVMLGGITPREAEVLRYRFGLETGEGMTLEEVANKFKLSRERIRQIEANALRILRQPHKSVRLKDYL